MTALHTTNPIPGAEIVNGVAYLAGPKGNLRRVDNIPAKDILVHEQVYRMIDYAKSLSAEIARFKSHTYGDLDALDALMDQEYGVTRKQDAKGNRHYTSADGKFQVRIRINTPLVIGPELQQAKALIDEIVLENGDGANPILVALVMTAFNVGKEGKVNVDQLRQLLSWEISDRRWPDIKRAISEAMKDGVSKSYITFHRWNGVRKGWDMIPLDLAGVEITTDVFEHPSLRRQVETARKTVDQALSALLSGHGIAAAAALSELLVEMGGTDRAVEVGAWGADSSDHGQAA